MTRFVVDASVAIKWFVREVHSDEARGLLARADELVAPGLIYAEFGSILWKKIRRDVLGVDDAWLILRSFEAMPIESLPANDLLPDAFEIVLAHGRSVYDSLYVASAIRREIPMVTADERLYNATRNGPLARHIVWVADPVEPAP